MVTANRKALRKSEGFSVLLDSVKIERKGRSNGRRLSFVLSRFGGAVGGIGRRRRVFAAAAASQNDAAEQ